MCGNLSAFKTVVPRQAQNLLNEANFAINDLRPEITNDIRPESTWGSSIITNHSKKELFVFSVGTVVVIQEFFLRQDANIQTKLVLCVIQCLGSL